MSVLDKKRGVGRQHVLADVTYCFLPGISVDVLSLPPICVAMNDRGGDQYVSTCVVARCTSSDLFVVGNNTKNILASLQPTTRVSRVQHSEFV